MCPLRPLLISAMCASSPPKAPPGSRGARLKYWHLSPPPPPRSASPPKHQTHRSVLGRIHNNQLVVNSIFRSYSFLSITDRKLPELHPEKMPISSMCSLELLASQGSSIFTRGPLIHQNRSSIQPQNYALVTINKIFRYL